MQSSAKNPTSFSSGSVKSYLAQLLALVVRSKTNKYEVADYCDDKDILMAKAYIQCNKEQFFIVIYAIDSNPKLAEILSVFYQKANKKVYLSAFHKNQIIPELNRLKKNGFRINQKGFDKFLASLI